MRLPARFRLKQARDFRSVREKGQSHGGKFLVLAVLRDQDVSFFQFGLITSRKTGTAVARNRIRRRLREIIRADQARIKPGSHLVLIARWSASDATQADLAKDWLRLARKADILLPLDPPPAA